MGFIRCLFLVLFCASAQLFSWWIDDLPSGRQPEFGIKPQISYLVEKFNPFESPRRSGGYVVNTVILTEWYRQTLLNQQLIEFSKLSSIELAYKLKSVPFTTLFLQFHLHTLESFRIYLQQHPEYTKAMLLFADDCMKNPEIIREINQFLGLDANHQKFVNYLAYEQHRIRTELIDVRIPELQHKGHRLLLDLPYSTSLQNLVSTVFDLTQRAPHCASVLQIYEWIDFADDLLSVGSTIIKAGKAAHRGVTEGFKKILELEHYRELAYGVANLLYQTSYGLAQADEVEDIMLSVDPVVTHDLLKFYNLRFKQTTFDNLRMTFELLQNSSWEQLVELGAEFSTTLFLDLVLFNAAGWVTSEAGKSLVKKLATTPEVCTGLAAEVTDLSKLMLEQGERVTIQAIEELKLPLSAQQLAKLPKTIELVPLHTVRKGGNIFEGDIFKESHIFSNYLNGLINY